MKIFLKFYLLSVLTLIGVACFAQSAESPFDTIYQLISQRNYFKARELYQSSKPAVSDTEQQVIEACLENAFNRPEESNRHIEQLLREEGRLPDSLVVQLFKIKEDNSVKLYDYREAKRTVDTLFARYRHLLSEEERKDKENNLKIWTALQDVPAQEIVIKEDNRLKMLKDKVGLDNLMISVGNDSASAIFDTGANLSTVNASTAKRFNMEVLPVEIDVETITGESVLSRLAVCPEFSLGNMVIKNAVFLVMDDEGLTFPQINYQIHGILGFPVIEGLGEIQITSDGYFMVPKGRVKFEQASNLAMDELTPLIGIEGRHFTFDTGAGSTLLYHLWYKENQQEIDANYQPTTVSFAGAGGKKEFEGYLVNASLRILDKTVELKDIQMVKDKIKPDETVYGNIGQDVIRQFDKMTINFDQMYIRFD